MTRQQVVRKQLIATGIVVVVVALVVAVNTYTRTFAYQVHLGKIVSATFSSGGPPAFVWTDPADLARIQAALPRYQPGAGYAPYTHTHQSMSLMLADDQKHAIFLALPGDDSALVLMNPRPPEYPVGNSWSMPKLLGTIGEIGMQASKAKQTAMDPTIAGAFQFWAETFGNKPKA